MTCSRPAEPARPPWFVLEVTRACNLACRFCCNPWSRDGAAESSEDSSIVYRVIDRLAPLGPAGFTISGGEPSYRRDLPGIVGKASATGARVILATNGTMLDQPMARALAEAGLSGFQISVPAAWEETYLSICGRDLLHEAWRGIRCAAATGLAVSAVFTLCSLNARETAGALQRCFAMGAGSFQLLRLARGGLADRSWAALAPTGRMIEEAVTAAAGLAGSLGVQAYSGIPLEPCLHGVRLQGAGCLGALAKWAVDPSGMLRPCEQSPVVLGGVLEQDPLALMGGDAAREFRTWVRGPGCHRCSLPGCGGGCRMLREPG